MASATSRGGSALGNLSFAIQDIITVMQYGGSFERAMLAAGNNIGFISTLLAPGLTGAVLGVVATLGVGLIPKLLSTSGEAKGLTEELEKLKSVLDSLKNLANVEIDISLASAELDAIQQGQKNIFGEGPGDADTRNAKTRTIAEGLEKDRLEKQLEADRLQAEEKIRADAARTVISEQIVSFLNPAIENGGGFKQINRLEQLLSVPQDQRVSQLTGQTAGGQDIFTRIPGRGADSPEQVRQIVRDYLSRLTPEQIGGLFPDPGVLAKVSAAVERRPTYDIGDLVSEDTAQRREAAIAIQTAIEAERLLADARNKAVEAAKKAQAEAEARQDAEDERKFAFRQAQEDADIRRVQLERQQQATKEGVSDYRKRRDEIINSEQTLLSKLAPEAADKLQVDKLLLPLQKVFGKQNPGAFAELRENLLQKPQEISGQFTPAAFVNQLTNSLLEKDKEPIELSPEAMDLLGKIEDHLRGLEGLGVNP